MRKLYVTMDYLSVVVSNNFSAESFLDELDVLCRKYSKDDWSYTFKVEEDEDDSSMDS
jgi:hypothetical protein